MPGPRGFEPTSKALRGEVPPLGRHGGQKLLEDAAFNVTRSFGRLVAGLSLRRCDIGGGRSMTYYDNLRTLQQEKRPVIVLVHGFNADKDHWLRMAAHLSHYRVIIPDLVAHGESWYDPHQTYDIPFYRPHELPGRS